MVAKSGAKLSATCRKLGREPCKGPRSLGMPAVEEQSIYSRS